MGRIVKLMLSGLFLFVVIFSYSQENSNKVTKPDRETKRKQKKLEKERKQAEQFAKFISMAENKGFVVEFNKLVISGVGDAYNINPTINFVAVMGDSAIIQFETNRYFSMNGLSGLTFIGKINNYKITHPKKKSGSIRISFYVVSKWALKGSLVSISVGDRTNSTVRLGTSVMAYGDFVKPEESKAIIGAYFGH